MVITTKTKPKSSTTTRTTKTRTASKDKNDVNDMIKKKEINSIRRNQENISQQILQIAAEHRNDKHWKKLLSLALDPMIYKKMMEEIKNFMHQFNRTYVMIKGYTKSAAKRIEEFRNNTFDQLLIHPNKYKTKTINHHQYEYNKNELDELQSSFDSYLKFILFDRIFNT